MSLKTFLEGLFPFLFNAIEREFDKLPKSEQDQLIQSGQFGQIIKTELSNGYHAILTEATKIGIDGDTANSLLIALGGKIGITATTGSDVIDRLQTQVNAGLQDSSWDALWTTVSGQLAIIIGGGAISWPTLALGLIEFVYTKFVKPKE